MEEVVFITNKIFIDLTLPEGGVRVCTLEFIDLLKAGYQVIFLPVSVNRSLVFRLKFKLGIDVYEDYNPSDYFQQLSELVIKKGIKKFFINLSNATDFAGYLKKTFPEHNLKTILCSHGNESGDFLHQSARFSNDLPTVKRLFSAWRLGKILQKEALYRLQYIDCVLTVSQVEERLEQWIGAKKTYLVPRVFKGNFLEWKPIAGRIGFVGDIRHEPNFYGLLQLCEAIEREDKDKKIELRLIGKEDENSSILKKKFSFVTALGYMDDCALQNEAATWSYYLNLVFYYSKGVSTKLSKGINWGLPVISTTAGNRGYFFRGGDIVTIDDPRKIVEYLLQTINKEQMVYHDREGVMKVVKNTITFEEIMKDLKPVLDQL